MKGHDVKRDSVSHVVKFSAALAAAFAIAGLLLIALRAYGLDPEARGIWVGAIGSTTAIVVASAIERFR